MAVTKISQSSGDWDSPGTWSPSGVPTAADDVIIQATHLVSLPVLFIDPTMECNNVEIESTGILLALGAGFIVHGDLDVYGQFLDANNLGVDRFKGKVTVHPGAQFNISSVSNVNNVVFEGGIEHNGTIFEVERCTFSANNQTITGTEVVSFPKRVNIDTGITLTNNSEAGMFFEEAAYITGVDGTSVFQNMTTVEYQGTVLPMDIGILDCSPPGNTFIYNKDGFSQDVKSATYDILIIGTDPLNSGFSKILDGDITVNNRLLIETDTHFEPGQYNVTVPGVTELIGTFEDDDPLGLNDLSQVEFNGGTIGGNGSDNGVFQIGTIHHSTGNGVLAEGDITISGMTTVNSGYTLSISNHNGTKTFGEMTIEAGATFNTTNNSSSTVAVFSDEITNNGTFTLQKGSYIFQAKFKNVGTISVPVSGGFYEFEGVFNNLGTTDLTSGTFTFHSSINGPSAIVINGKVQVADGKTAINGCNGGITINGSLNGLSATSTFQNRKELFYNPTSAAAPMLTGTLAAHFVDNTFRYSRASGNQNIRSAVYHHLILEPAGNAVLNDGDLEIRGDLTQLANQTGGFKFIFNGTLDQNISGGGPMRNVEVNKASGNVIVNNSFFVQTDMTFISGIMHTGNSVITLGSSAFFNETNLSYVEGIVETTRPVGSGASNTFGGIGLTLSAAAGKPMGQTLVRRTTNDQLNAGAIRRYFDITPTNNTGLNTTMVFEYRDAELNGLIESNLVLLESTMGGPLVNMGGLLDVGANTLTLNSLASFDQWTAGDPSAFPVVLLSFEGTALESDVYLEWITAKEENNDRFEIERSLTGMNFTTVGSTKGVGTTNAPTSYTFLDTGALNIDVTVLYYRLKQIDLDGTSTYSPVIAVSVEREDLLTITAYPVPFTDYLRLNIYLDTEGQANIQLFDLQGRQLYASTKNGLRGINSVEIPTANLSSGVYTLRVSSLGRSHQIKVVKE